MAICGYLQLVAVAYGAPDHGRHASLALFVRRRPVLAPALRLCNWHRVARDGDLRVGGPRPGVKHTSAYV